MMACTGTVHLKNFEYHEKDQYLGESFQKEKLIRYIDLLHME